MIINEINKYLKWCENNKLAPNESKNLIAYCEMNYAQAHRPARNISLLEQALMEA